MSRAAVLLKSAADFMAMDRAIVLCRSKNDGQVEGEVYEENWV